MTFERPDKRHDFTGWSIERFGARHFVIWGEASSGCARLARYEMDANDFADARGGRIGLGALRRKYDADDNAFFAGIADPKPWVKVYLIGCFIFIAGALVALILGWI